MNHGCANDTWVGLVLPQAFVKSMYEMIPTCFSKELRLSIDGKFL